jgi:hypothetical protein
LTSLPQLAKDLAGVGDASKGVKIDSSHVTDLSDVVNQIVSFFGKMTTGAGKDDSPFKLLAGYLTSSSIVALARAKGGIDTVKNTFQMLGEIPKVIHDFSSATGDADVNSDKLVAMISTISDFFQRITVDGGPLTTISSALRRSSITDLAKQGPALQQIKIVPKVLADFQEIISKLSDSFKSIGGDQTGLASVMMSIDSMMSQVGKLDIKGQKDISSTIDTLRNFGDNMSAVSDVLKGSAASKGGIVGALLAVSDMVKQANDLDKALSDGNVNKIDIKAKLERVAKAVGLGGKASYTVNPSKEIALTVNLTVVMEAGEVEKMILTGKSVIRDRLNGATVDHVGQHTSDSIKEDGTAQWPAGYTSK